MTKGQSKFRSFLEANVNTLVGFILTFAFSPLFYKLVGITYTYKQLGIVTLLFTLLSVIRGYVIRRWFNKKEEQKDLMLQKTASYYQKLSVLHNDRSQQWKDLYLASRSDRAKLNDQIRSLKDELDMCKHHNLAVVSDLVEGANYHHGDGIKQSLDDYIIHTPEEMGLPLNNPLLLKAEDYADNSEGRV